MGYHTLIMLRFPMFFIKKEDPSSKDYLEKHFKSTTLSHETKMLRPIATNARGTLQPKSFLGDAQDNPKK